MKKKRKENLHHYRNMGKLQQICSLILAAMFFILGCYNYFTAWHGNYYNNHANNINNYYNLVKTKIKTRNNKKQQTLRKRKRGLHPHPHMENFVSTTTTKTTNIKSHRIEEENKKSNNNNNNNKWKGKIAHYGNVPLQGYDIQYKMELFIDNFIIETMSDNVEFVNSQKIRESKVVLKLEHPWERSTGFLNYATVIEDERDGSLLMYYRCYAYRLGIDKKPTTATKAYMLDRNYCVAKSTDGGMTFIKPELEYYTWGADNRKTNIIGIEFDAFTPIYDNRPNILENERFKSCGSHRQNIWNMYASPDGLNWHIVKKQIVDTRNVIKKKKGLIYAYDSTMNLIYDDVGKRFSLFTRGVKKWTQRTVMSGIAQKPSSSADLNNDWATFIDEADQTKPSANFELIKIHPPFEPFEGLYSTFPQKGIGGSNDKYTQHLWFMAATRYHGGRLFVSIHTYIKKT